MARVLAGRRQAGRCRAVSRRNRGRGRCTRLVMLGGGFGRVAAAGINRFRFTGRLGGSTLSPGRYRLIAVPRGAGGQAGAAATVDFVIVSRLARRAVAVR